MRNVDLCVVRFTYCGSYACCNDGRAAYNIKLNNKVAPSLKFTWWRFAVTRLHPPHAPAMVVEPAGESRRPSMRLVVEPAAESRPSMCLSVVLPVRVWIVWFVRSSVYNA